MCLLSFYPPGVLTVKEHLEAGARLNPHGCGYALAAGGLIFEHRSLDSGEAISRFLALRASCPDSHALFHSRKASVASVTLENCHPFPVRGDNPGFVAHNGWLFHAGNQSDTRVFAEEILPRYNLDDPEDFRRLDGLMGFNKAVVLFGDRAHILGEHLGIWLPDGSWHSNGDYTGVHASAGLCVACKLVPPEPGAKPAVCAGCGHAASVRYQRMTENVRYQRMTENLPGDENHSLHPGTTETTVTF
jgi:glutamine amidotransferase